MNLKFWLKKIFAWNPSTVQPIRTRQLRRLRLEVERLEDRWVPSLTINYWQGTTTVWATSGNWSQNHAPLSNEIAVFDGTHSTHDVNLGANAISVQAFEINTGYSGTITANSALGSLSITTSTGFSQSAGTFTVSAASYNISDAGDWTLNGGTFTAGASTVTMNGTAAQVISGTAVISFKNLTDSNTTSAVSATSSLNVTGTLTINSGTDFAPAATALINTAAGTSTLTGTGLIEVTHTGATITGDLAAQYVFNTYTLTGLTAKFDGASDQSIDKSTAGGVGAYGAMTTSGSSTQTLAGNVTVNGNVTIGTGTTLAAGARTITVGGNWTNNGSFTQTAAGTVRFNATSAQTIGGSATTTFGNLIIINGVGGSVALGSSVSATVGGDFTLTTGSFSTGANTLTLDGSFTNSVSNAAFASTGTVIFAPGAAETISGVSTTFNNLTISGAGSVALSGVSASVGGSFSLSGGTFTQGTGNNLTVTGDFTLAAGTTFTKDTSTGTLTFNGTGNLTDSHTIKQDLGNVIVSAGTRTLTTSITVSSLNVSAGTLTQGAGDTLTVGGNFTLANGTTFNKDTSTGKLTFNGGGTLTDGNTTAQDLGKVTIANNSTVTLASNILMSGLTIGTGSTFALAGNNFSFSAAAAVVNNGTFQLDGNETLSNVNNLGNTAGTVVYVGNNTTGPLTINPPTSYFNLTINDTNTTKATYQLGANTTIAGAFTLTSGTFNQNNHTLSVAKDFTLANGTTFTKASGGKTLTLSATGSLTDSNATPQNLGAVIISGGTRTLGSAITLDSLSVSAGTLAQGTNHNLTVGGNFSLSNNTTFAKDTSSGTLTFNGPGAITDSNGSPNDLGNVVITNSSTVTLASAVLMDGLTINSGSTFSLAGNSFSFSSSAAVANSGAFQFQGVEILTNVTNLGTTTGTVVYVGDNTGTTLPLLNYAYYNLTINDTHGINADTFQAPANLIVNGALSLQGGTYDANAFTTAVTGLTTVAGGKYLASTNTQTLSGGLTVSSGTFTGSTGVVTTTNVTLSHGTLTAPSTTLNIAGNFSDTGGTFSANGGTVNFNGTGAQTIGGTTFNNLTINNGVGGSVSLSGTPITVSGDFTLSAGSFSDAGQTLNIGGSFINNAGATAFSSTGMVNFTGAAGETLGGSAATTFDNLTINKVPGNTLTLAADATVSGDFLLTKGNFDTSTHTLTLDGNYTNNSGANAFISTGLVSFSGTSATTAQTIAGTFATKFDNLTIANTADAVSATTNFKVAGTMTVNANSTFAPVASVLINNGGMGTSILTGSGTIDVTHLGSSTGDFSAQYNFNTTTLAGLTVDFDGAGAQTIDSSPGTYGALATDGSGTKTLGGAVTVSGALTIGAGTTLDISATGNFTLNVGGNWINNGAFSAESGAVLLNGSAAQSIGGALATTFNNLTINNAAGVANTITGTTVNGFLTLTKGAFTLTNGLTMGTGATISRSLGSLSAAPTFGTTVNVIYTGTTALSTGPELPASTTVLNNLTISDTGGVTLAAAATVNHTLSLGNGAFHLSGGVLTLASGSTIDRSNGSIANANPTLTGTINLIYSNTNPITSARELPVSTSALNNLTINNSATVTLAAGKNRTVNGTLTLTGANASVDPGDNTITVAGGFTNNASTTAFIPNTSTVVFGGSAAQALGGSAATTFNNLTINNAAGVTDNVAGTTINGTLTLSAGVVSTGSNTLVVSSPNVSASNGAYVLGNLQEFIAAGNNVSATFPVGTSNNSSSDYTPVTLSFATVTTGGAITVAALAGNNVSIGTSSLDAAHTVTNNWSIGVDNNLAFNMATASFTFTAQDVAANTSTSALAFAKLDGSTWTYPSAQNRLATSTQAIGLTSFGSTASPSYFQLGQDIVAPQAAITTPPLATVNIANATSEGTYTITVHYSDNVALDVGTLASSTLSVVGPNSFSQSASFVSVDVSANGTPRTATYQFTHAWTAGTDDGTYTVSLPANTVYDTAGNPVAAGALGTFVVDLTAPTLNSINRSSPASQYTNATGVTFLATFSEPVTSVPASDFSFDANDTATAGTIGTPTSSDGGLTWSIPVTGLAGAGANGTLQLDLASNALINDLHANPLSTSSLSGQSYTLDNIAPTVSSVSPSVTTIADAQFGIGGFQLTITFSEPMDTSVNPTVSFSPDVSSTLSANATYTGWTSPTTLFIAGYDVALADVAVSPIKVTVTGAQDLAGNAQNTFTDQPSGFTIDTVSPTVSSIIASVPYINLAQAGSTFSVTVAYDTHGGADMDTTNAPAISFLQNGASLDLSSLLTFTSGSWSNNVYTANYTVSSPDDGSVDPNIEVTADGAKNLDGNAQDPDTVENVFSVDTVAPVVTLASETTPTNNNEPTFSGVGGLQDGDSGTVYVNIYSGNTSTGTPIQQLSATVDPDTGAYSIAPTTALTDGIYTAQASQSDAAGNTSTSSTTTFTVDITPPHTSDSLSGTLGNNSYYTTNVSVTLTPSDATSGVASTSYSLDGGNTWTTYTVPFTVSTQGSTTVEYYSVDNAGNQETTKSDSFQIDTVKPHTSDSLSGTLGNNSYYTTNVQVTLSPSDATSGVASTSYSLDGGTTWHLYSSAFTVSTQGSTTVEYYSVDNAGNQETTKSDSFQIDTVKPHTSDSLSGTLGNNSYYTTNVQVTLSPSDATSGVASTSYSLDGGTTWHLYSSAFTVSTQGSTTVEYYSVDNAGNQETTKSDSFQIDTVKPHTSDSLSGTLGNNSYYTTNVQVTLSPSDATSGVASTSYSLDGGNTWTTYTVPFTVSTQGSTTVEYYSVDNAGNQETTKSDSFQIDTVKPHTSDSLSGTLGNNSYYTTNVQVTLSPSDATSGVASTSYSLDGGTTWHLYSSAFTVSTQGSTTVEYYSVDNAGNQETTKSDSFQIDTVKPHTSDSLSGTLGNNSYYTTNVQVTLSPSDATSGVASTSYSLDGGNTWTTYTVPFTVSTQGSTTVEYYSVDNAGNQETTKSDSFQIDTVKPHTSDSLSGTLGNNSYYTTNVQVTLSPSDATSGVASTSYSLDGGTTWHLYSSAFTVSTQGSTTVEYYSVDNAGNQETTKSDSFQIDTVKPHTSDSLSGTLGNNSYYTTNVQVTLSPSDATSGVASTSYSLDGGNTWTTYTVPFTVSTQGSTTVEYYSVDNAGNQETTKSDSFQIDTVKPHTSDSLSGTLGNNSYYTTNVQVTLSPSDATSGVASTSYSLDGGTTWHLYSSAFTVSTQGSTTVEYYSVDNAGNQETTKSDSFQIDTVKPHTSDSLSGTLGNNSYYTTNVQVTLSPSDATSGVASTSYSLDGGTTWHLYSSAFTVSTQGSTTVEYYSVDHAGNQETTKSDSFQIDTVAPTATLAASLTAVNIANAGSQNPYVFTVSFADNIAVDVGTLSNSNILVTGPNHFSQSASYVSVNPTGNGTPRTATYKLTHTWAAGDTGTFTVALQGSQVKDLAGNSVAAGTLGTFGVDMIAPTLSSVVPSVNPITDAQLGGTFSLTLTYSEAMNTALAAAPSIAFSSVPSVNALLTFQSGSWNQAATVYTAVYNVASTSSVNIAAVTVSTSGAKDVDGNVQTASMTTSTFAVATLNPTVLSVTPSVATIGNAQVGNNGFSLAVKYSASMNSSVAPTLSFNPTVSSTLTLNTATSSWNGAHTIYTAYYNVTNAGVSVPSVSVSVSGAKDVHNNLQVAANLPSVFAIYSIAPALAIGSAPNLYTDTQSNVSVSGTGTIGATITVVISDAGNLHHTTTATTTVNNQGTWSVSGIVASSLNSGTITYTVKITDHFGNTTTKTKSATKSAYSSHVL